MTPQPPTPSPGRSALWLRLLGGAVVVASAVWIVPQFAGQWDQVRRQDMAPGLLMTILAVTPLYTAALGALAVAWWWLCNGESGRPPLAATAGVWMRSQVAKYLPGNLMHYLGRHLYGSTLGVPQRALALASVLELVGCAIAAALLGLPVLLARLALPTAPTLVAVIGAAIAGLVVLAVVGRRLRSLSGTVLGTVRRKGPGAFLLQVTYFLASGLLVWILLTRGLGVAAPPLLVVGTVATAWLLGTFTPGAPGGIGVREATLTWLLAPAVGDGTAAVLAIAWRLVTFLGDLLAAAVGWLPRARPGDS